MDTKLLITFILLNVANVLIQTVKSLATVKCGKLTAAVVNAVAYGLYTVVVVYMMADLPLFWKAAIIALCNLVGVYIVKWGEEKARKDRLWKVEATVYDPYTDSLHDALNEAGLPHNYITGIGKYTVFNIFCETQADSAKAKRILDYHKAKYFVSESKTL